MPVLPVNSRPYSLRELVCWNEKVRLKQILATMRNVQNNIVFSSILFGSRAPYTILFLKMLYSFVPVINFF